jgi:DNA-binding transcriptional ArsR family regulator
MPKEQQGDLFKAETTWFHLFHTMFSNGDVAKLGASAFTLYCAIKAHTSFKTGESFPSHKRLIELTGLSDSTVKRTLAELTEAGYVSVEKRGRKNFYKLREKVLIQDGHGRPAAVATWDYLPASVQAAVADLQNVLVAGNFAGAKVVQIQHMTVNVNNGNGTQINVDLSGVKDAAMKEEFKDILKEATRTAKNVNVIDAEDVDFQQ